MLLTRIKLIIQWKKLPFMYGVCRGIGNKTEWDVRFYPDICRGARPHIGPIHSHYTPPDWNTHTRPVVSPHNILLSWIVGYKQYHLKHLCWLEWVDVLLLSHSLQFAECDNWGRPTQSHPWANFQTIGKSLVWGNVDRRDDFFEDF